MEANCCSSGGDDGGDEGEPKNLNSGNCSTLITAATAELPVPTLASTLTVEDKVVVMMEGKEETVTGGGGDLEETSTIGGDLEETAKKGGDLEETQITCVCAACCVDLEDILEVTKEDDLVFHWFLKWFRFDHLRRKERRYYYETHGGWDGQGGKCLRFCEPCKAEVMGLMQSERKVWNRGPSRKTTQVGKDVTNMRMRIKEFEEKFEAKKIYERDNRYWLLRVKLCKLASCAFLDPSMWKKKKATEEAEGLMEVNAEKQEEAKEETPTIRVSRRVKKPVIKYVPPVVRGKKVKVAFSEGTSEEKGCKADGVTEGNAVMESEPEVQVKMEEFPEEDAEDMEVDNGWFNEDCETEKMVKIEEVGEVDIPKLPVEDPPRKSQKSRKRDKRSKTRRGSLKRVSGPKSKVGARAMTKVNKVKKVTPWIKPVNVLEKAAAVYVKSDLGGGGGGGDENCLFCYRGLSPEEIKLKRAITSDTVEANFNTFFILSKMLQVPKSILADYLVKCGDPRNWIQFCRECLSVVDEAVAVQKKIEQLEIKLRRLQNGMVERIKLTFDDSQIGEGHQKKRKKRLRPGSRISAQITQETRQFICKKSSTPADQPIPEVPTQPVPLVPLSSPPSHHLDAIPEKDPLANLEISCDVSAIGDDSNDHDNDFNEDVPPSSPPSSPLPLSLSRKRRRVAPDKLQPVCQLQETLEDDLLDIFGEDDSVEAFVEDDANDQDYDITEDVSPLSPESPSPPPSPVPVSLSVRRKRWAVPFRKGELGGNVRKEKKVNKDVVEKKVSLEEEDPLNQGSYKCSLCPNLKAMSIGKFYVHGLFHYKRQFKCSECDMYWSGPDELKKNPFNPCNKPATRNKHVCSEETLEKVSEFRLGKIWKCNWCPEDGEEEVTFDLDSERDIHEAECPGRKNDDGTDKFVELKFECLSCPDKKGFRSHEEWLLHRILEHPQICVTSCLYCNETFAIKTNEGIDVLDRFAQKNHISSNHPTQKPVFQEACDFCGLARKRDRADIGCHMLNSHGLGYRDSRHCPICHFRCSRYKSLRRHLRLNHFPTSLIKYPNKTGETLGSGRIASTSPRNQLKALQQRMRKNRAKLGRLRDPEEYDKDGRLQEGNYRCSLCPPSLTQPMSLVEFYGHVIFHFRRPFKCCECNLYWSSPVELGKNPFTKKLEKSPNEHICSNETLRKIPEFQPGKIWKCAGCPETFSKDTDRDLHEEAECPNKPTTSLEYKCLSCDDDDKMKGNRSYEEWLLHRVLEHTEIAITSCLFCDEKRAIKTNEGIDFFDTAAMRLHVTTEHPSCTQTKVYATHVCDFCGVTFQSNPDLRRHVKDVHELNELNAVSCRSCYYRSERFTNMKTHTIRRHAVHREKAEGKICDVCGIKLCKAGEFSLADHKLIKHGIEPPADEEFQKRIKTCGMEGCGYRTLDSTHFKVHMMKMHGAERSHKCHICGKGFLGSGKLAVHLKIHENKETKPHQCEICGNSFAVRNYLYIHMRLTHLNRPFASTHKKKPPRRSPAVRKVNRDAGNGPAQVSHHLQEASQQPSQSAPVLPCSSSSSGNIFMEAFTTFPFNNT